MRRLRPETWALGLKLRPLRWPSGLLNENAIPEPAAMYITVYLQPRRELGVDSAITNLG